ncbi:MAG: NAD(P)-binding protein [Myxococcota bacterium]
MRYRYYDVVVLGGDLGGCLTAALAAKRGLRVLLLGQGARPAEYRIGGHAFPRAPYTFGAAHSETAKRVLGELAMGQVFRRRAAQMDPTFQLATPSHRIDAPADPELFEREIEREFPDVRRAALDVLRLVQRTGAELEQVLERSPFWPPTTFLQRREFARATAHRVFDRSGAGFDPFAQLPSSHPLRTLVGVPGAFAANLDPAQLPPLAVLRLFESWTRGSARLRGGLRWFIEALVERIEANSGDVRIDEGAEALLTKRGAVTGVRLAASDEEIGAGAVVCAIPVMDAAKLLADRGLLGELFERHGEPSVRYFRYTLNILAAEEGFPVGMGRDVFSIFDDRSPRSGANMLRLSAAAPDGSGTRLLTVEALLPRREVEEVGRQLRSARERILGAVTELAPFFGDHIHLVDSPHDGRDLQDFAQRTSIAPEKPWTRGPSTMKRVHGFPVLDHLGCQGMPVLTPVRNLLLSGSQIWPALGEEGLFLAAQTAAEQLLRSERGRSWKRFRLRDRLDVG